MAAAPLKSMTQYGGRYLVTLIPGDGIGKEMTNCVKAVFNHMKVPVDFDEVHLSGYDTADTSSKSYKVAVESLRRTKIGLKGIATNRGFMYSYQTTLGTVFTPTEGHKSYNLALRKELDIFANIVPIKSVQGVPSRFTGIDFVIIRENTEGEYSGLEHCVINLLRSASIHRSQNLYF